MRNYSYLKSGTDIRGKAIFSETDGEEVLDEEAVTDIVKAYMYWMNARCGNRPLSIALGGDSRLTTFKIYEIASRAVRTSGGHVYRCGLCSTPSLYMMTQYEDILCDGAVMITASHHPFDRNGLKFFTKEGGIRSSDLDAIIALASRKQERMDIAGEIREGDFLGKYCESLKARIRGSLDGREHPLKGLRIVVDAGNGAAGFFAARILAPLGADTEGSQYLEPDGNFPAHVPNPEDPEAMRSIAECTVRNQADLGIIFDTDGDRAAIVTADGQEMNRNRLIAVIAAVLLKEQPGAAIVTDSVTSNGLQHFIERLGGKHVRYKRGYRNVIDKAIALNAEGVFAPLAIETSGHAAFMENFFLDDGAYLAVRLIIEAVRLKQKDMTLKDLIADLKEAKESAEARILLTGNDWKTDARQILIDMEAYAQSHHVLLADSYEGIRANVPGAEGWYLVRLSVHDPVLPVNIESDKEGGAAQIAAELYDFLARYDRVNCSALQRLL